MPAGFTMSMLLLTNSFRF